jgi:hypothetical protein
MSTFIDQLAEISRRQGREFIDPTRIEGFGPGNAPAPLPPTTPPEQLPVPHIPSARDLHGDPVEFSQIVGEMSVAEPAPSPLVELGKKAAPPEVPVVPVNEVPTASLVIVGRNAVYRDRPVLLNDTEHAAVVAIVLKAIRRDLDVQYQELTGRRPRTRKAKKASEPVAAAVAPTPRKRGRPRKVVEA